MKRAQQGGTPRLDWEGVSLSIGGEGSFSFPPDVELDFISREFKLTAQGAVRPLGHLLRVRVPFHAVGPL